MNDLLNKVVGQDGVKFSISVEWDTILYLAGGALVVGVLLILISKKLIK